MKKNLLFSLVLMLLLLSFGNISWADDDSSVGTSNPFGPEYSFQGYTILEFIFPNVEREYALGEVWGTNPKDGKVAVSAAHISPRMKYFLDAFGYRYDATSNKYDIHSQPVMIGLLVNPDHGGIGTGKYINVENPYALTQEELAQLAKGGIWLINPAPGSPLPPDPNAPMGYLSVIQPAQPDFRVKSPQMGITGFINQYKFTADKIK